MTARVEVTEELEAANTRGMATAHHAAQAPDRPALLSPHGDRTYGELNARANRLARALRSRGLRAGDAVALLCRNRPEFTETMLAAQRSGLRVTPINWHLNAEEVAYIVRNCEARAFVADASFAPAAADAARVAPEGAARLAVAGAIEGFDAYDDSLTAEDPSDLDDPEPGWAMMYTSGTTGKPKGVHRTEPPPSARIVIGMGRYRADSVHLCTGPLYHSAPLLFSMTVPLLAGVTVIVMDGWEAEDCLRLIDEHRITHTHMVPTMFHRLLALPDEVRAKYDVSSLRYVVHGAAPCPVSVKRRMIEWLGPVVHEYYAATEGLGAFVDAKTWLEKPGTVGRPVPDDQVLVGDEDARRLPPGEVGLLWFKAPAQSRFRYFKDDEKTSSTYRGDYFTLGDVGYADEDGFLFLTDRTADLIISGGVNIYPAEVDAVMLEHPAVGDAATIGVPDEEWGEAVLAVVEPGVGVVADAALAEELVTFCRGRLAHYKCPRRVEFVADLPRQDNGKIYKRLLRERYRATFGPEHE